jgi:hypothetical protein
MGMEDRVESALEPRAALWLYRNFQNSVGLLTILCELIQFVSDECCCAGYASSAPFTPFAARVHPRQKSRKRIGDNSV